MSDVSQYPAVSLFSCAGIGDLGFRAAGARFVAMNELEPDRAALARLNFPEAQHITGDILEAKSEIIDSVSSSLMEDLFLVTCTAPCQGMSSAGMGSLLRNTRDGKRSKWDPRNRLILPALDVIKELRPKWAVFENVVGMRNTVILDRDGEPRRILDIIDDELGALYVGRAYAVEFADYGVPQRRQRLITVYGQRELAAKRIRQGHALIPSPTHSRDGGSGLARWIGVGAAIEGFPPLDSKELRASANAEVPFHRVPVLDERKYWWVANTPPGRSAFDNQCVNPDCGFDGNTNHAAKRGADGINRARVDTPLYCEKCDSLLPRPATLEDGRERIMKGYTSAYKRMAADLPAPTISRNLSFPCSDQKIHPFQNRVLSLAEAIHLQTIDRFDYKWGPLEYVNGRGKSICKRQAPDTLVRLAIAESIPPAFTEALFVHLLGLSEEIPLANGAVAQGALWE